MPSLSPGSLKQGSRALFKLVSGLALAVASSGALAQASEPNDTSPAEIMTALEKCRAVGDDAARLACYDRDVAVLVSASEKGTVSLVSQERVEKTRRGLFGFSLPRVGLFGGGDGELTELESTITGVRRYGRDGYVLTIAEGSEWQIASAPMRLRTPEGGDPVVLRKASLGYYFLRIDGQNGVKARRVR